MTRRFVLIGNPVEHSVSPAIHRAAYAALGLTDCVYDLCRVENKAALRDVVAKLRSGKLAGANVTVPWKSAALEFCDRADRVAARAGAANTLVRNADGTVSAHNTDVPALASELEERMPPPFSALVLGNGGAARAAVLACRQAGAEDVLVLARRWTDEPGPGGRVAFEALGAATGPWPAGGDTTLSRWARHGGVMVQATSAGMLGGGSGEGLAGLVPWDLLAPGTLVYDLVYNPRVTPILEAARARGFPAESGLGMLVRQASLALELWLGRRVEPAPLVVAAERALGASRT